MLRLLIHRYRANLLISILLGSLLMGLETQNPLARYVDSEITVLHGKTTKEIQEARLRVDALQKEVQALQAEIRGIQGEIQILEKKKSIFNRNEKRIQEKSTRLHTREEDLRQKSQAFERAKYALGQKTNLLRSLAAEIQTRQTQEKFRLTKTVDLYETAELVLVKDAYGAMLERHKAQLEYARTQLKQWEDPAQSVDKGRQEKIAAWNQRVADLEKETTETAMAYHAILAAITGRKEDQSFEREELEARREAKRMFSEYEAKRKENLEEEKRGEEMLKKSPLSPLFQDQRMMEIQDKEKREKKILKVVFFASIGLFVLILLFLKRAFS